MFPFSVVIITLNEERNIGRCLESVGNLTDDIVVVDSGSTDATVAICEQYGVRLIHQPWLGYGPQKNVGNEHARYDYILSLDADEALSEELRQSLQSLAGQPAFSVYEMNRLTNYCGHWVHHCGWYPDRKPRLFDRRVAKWDAQALHEDLSVEAGCSRGFLQGDILHYSYYSISDHLRQINHFTEINARFYYEKGKKISFFRLLVSMPVRFMRDYFLKLGFLDGYYGFVICRLSAEASFIKYLKIRQLQKQHADTSQSH